MELNSCSTVADPEGGGGVRGFNPPPFRGGFFFGGGGLSVYENSPGPGP